MLLLTSLCLHLLDFNCVRFAAAHVQFVISHAQCQDSLIDAQARGKEHKVLGWRRGRENERGIERERNIGRREKG